MRRVSLCVAACCVGWGVFPSIHAAGAAEIATSQDAIDEVDPTLLGRRVAEFTLKDYRGKPHSLADHAGRRAVVLLFMGVECPLAKLYGPRMQELADEYASRGVAVLGIDSNVQDSITEMAAFARSHGIDFPILKDLGNRLADELGATRTPQVFVLDADRRVRYAGRVDAQFTFGSGVGLSQPHARRADLAVALDELLAGGEISVPLTEAKGCLIGRAREADERSLVTYSNQIARIFQARCVECHREGQIAPFAMTDHAEVAGWGEMIAEVVREERMPPWHADPRFGHFANDSRLSDEEKRLIATWVEHGCPEGDRSQLPVPKTYNASWFLPRDPDMVVYMKDEPYHLKAEGVEPYRHFTVDPGFTEDKWVKLAECMPGNRAVVHHIIVFVKPPGADDEPAGDGEGEDDHMHFLAGFAPGTRPLVAPQGWAKKIPAGSKLVFQMHYTPIGTPQDDRSSVGLIFCDGDEVTHLMQSVGAAYHDLEIPPNEANYQVESIRKFSQDVTLLSMFPHMHMRGKAFRYEMLFAGADEPVVLLDVPRYDFNWQNSFILTKPLHVPAGSVLRCTAVFDNSSENLSNPDPTKTVCWGPQTWEEMMIGWHEIGWPVAKVDGEAAIVAPGGE